MNGAIESVKRVTLADVANEAEVSPTLVSYALRGTSGVSDATRARIVAIAARMGYQPNVLAARLAKKQDTTLGVFLGDLHNEVFADMFDGMRDGADEHHRELVVTIGSLKNGGLDRRALDSLVSARVDVAIAAGLLLPDHELAEYRGRLRIVSVARTVPGFDSVASDDALGAVLATDHLLSLGHRRILHLASPPTEGYLGRRQGYSRTMKRAGLLPWVVTYSYSRAAAKAAALAVFRSDERPSAIFTNNDEAAVGVLEAALDLGLSIPDDVSVVGYDNTTASEPPGIPLTTVDLHPFTLGRRAAEIAVERSQDPTSEPITELFRPTLVVRSSTTRPPLG